jgi:hypothetical protein
MCTRLFFLGKHRADFVKFGHVLDSLTEDYSPGVTVPLLVLKTNISKTDCRDLKKAGIS